MILQECDCEFRIPKVSLTERQLSALAGADIKAKEVIPKVSLTERQLSALAGADIKAKEVITNYAL